MFNNKHLKWWEVLGGFGIAFITLLWALQYSARISLSSYDEIEQIQTRKAEENRIPKLRYTTDELYAEYEDNEIRADQHLKGKYITIAGVISSIGKDILGSPYIVLKCSNDFDSIQCIFPKSDINSLMELSTGQHVDVVGEVTGKCLFSILLKECRLI